MEAPERMPFTSLKQVFKALAEYAERHSLNKEENERYEESLWRAMDAQDFYLDAIHKGRAEGRAEGWAEGWAKGWAEGWAKGWAEGWAKKEEEMVLSFLQNGVSPEIIAKSCSISMKQIKELSKRLESDEQPDKP